jgi:8-oxo-dGTP pyrophosphatase MutT (NUDIX family)
MLETERLGNFLKREPHFKIDWVQQEDGSLYHKKFGKVKRVVVSLKGKPLFDSFVFAQEPISVVVPYAIVEGVMKVVFVVQERHPTGELFYEVPGGCSEGQGPEETARVELYEEAGIKAEKFEKIGSVYPDTGFYSTAFSVFATMVKSIDNLKSHSHEEGEVIERVVALSYKEVVELQKEGKMRSGVTLAALSQFIMHYPEFVKSST